MEILLTGATGFIGTHLLTDLAHWHRLYALTRQNPLLKKDGLTWLPGDLSWHDFASSLPDKIDAAVCLAQSKVYRQFPEQAHDIFDVNVRSTLALLEYARRAGARIFIFTSTANVYRQSSQRITEDFAVEPNSFYARSKRMAEMLVESYAKFFNCIVLRLFTAYGPGQKEMLIPNLIERVRHDQPLQVQGQHGFKTSPVYVGDVKNVILRILEREKISPGFEIFNVGGDEMLGIYELGLLIGKALNTTPHFDYIAGDEPPGWMADTSKLKAALGLGSFTSFASGIKQMVERVIE